MLGLPTGPDHAGRLPLHLRYRFEQPGIYEVRYTGQSGFKEETSAWTPIQIQPATPGERARWLANIHLDATTSTAELLTDTLPGILGVADEQTLRIVSSYLYHPDTLVRQFALHGLANWPYDIAKEEVRKAASTKGPTDAVVEFLRSDAGASVELAIPYLKSNSPLLLRGAVTAIKRAAPSLDPALRTRANDAMLQAAEHIVQVADDQTKADYAAALGVSHPDGARSILWSFVQRRIALDQSLIALTWIHSPSDLPKLVQLALTSAQGHPLSYDFASLPYALHRGYGEAALPYLETLLEKSEFTWVRTNSARELAAAGHATGFRFIGDSIENNRPYRSEMVQFVRDQFPELRSADETAIGKFIRSRQ